MYRITNLIWIRNYRMLLFFWIHSINVNLKQFKYRTGFHLVLKHATELGQVIKSLNFHLNARKNVWIRMIGQATGLEPRTVYVIWRPSVDDTPERKGVILAIFFFNACINH